ncbi:MAG: ImmA/IrrE family metallo-endopeptidase [Chitinophagales bacterium]|nr:ImmA/IrrE family metallo-endopeptidase [Chitinophagales bacterium]
MSFIGRVREINIQVSSILQEFVISSLPVKIEDIAKGLGLKVIPYAFEEDISGTLIIEKKVIGFNQTESRVRRRFTIAHELGHYILHQNKKAIFLDKLFRLNNTSDEQNPELEMEANIFAASILMPEKMLKSEVENIEFDLGNDEAIKYLARIFDVSSMAMYYRLLNLNLITPH